MAKCGTKSTVDSAPIKEEMLTAAKIAEKFNLKPAQVKKAIEELAIAPDMKKGVCSYFTMENAQKIKDAVK